MEIIYNYLRDMFHSGSFAGDGTSRRGESIIALVISVVLFLVYEYFALVPFNLRSPVFLTTVGGFVLLYAVIRVFLCALFDVDLKTSVNVCMVIALALFIFSFVGEVYSSAVFHASSYQQMLGIDEDADFYADNEEVNYQSIPVVDKDSASRLGDRKMGEIVDYVSQFEVDDEYSQINYHDTPYRVTTISYSDIIKWFTNHSNGLPAYITVNMVTQEAEVVRLDECMRYSHSDMFFRDIDRYLRIKYPTLMFDETSFEIDEDGIPYWVASTYKYTIGLFGGKDIDGIVLVNAVTGECQYYDIDDVPEWIDRVYSSDIVLDQLSYYGKYKNGFWNSIFSQKGVLQSTDGYNYVALNDDVYLYTGLTSVSSDESNVGFALINLRTKESKYYAISGAEEYSAMSSAEGKVQNLQYVATFPILINESGQPTYFLSLKDDAGLVKQYAFVNVKNYQIVATGESVAVAEQNYYKLLEENELIEEAEVSAVYETVSGKINSLSSAVVDGNTYYYFKIKDDDTIYIAAISANEGLPLMEVGDKVEFEYDKDSSQTDNIVSITLK